MADVAQPEENVMNDGGYCSSDDNGEAEAARIEQQKLFADLKTRSPEEIKEHAVQTAKEEGRTLSQTQQLVTVTCGEEGAEHVSSQDLPALSASVCGRGEDSRW